MSEVCLWEASGWVGAWYCGSMNAAVMFPSGSPLCKRTVLYDSALWRQVPASMLLGATRQASQGCNCP